MPAFVTGGTGFVGSRVVRKLLARGETVRCLARDSSPRQNLEGLPVEVVVGDLRDPASLERAVRGCDQVFHVAADYRLWSRDPKEVHQKLMEAGALELSPSAIETFKAVKTAWDGSAPAR